VTLTLSALPAACINQIYQRIRPVSFAALCPMRQQRIMVSEDDEHILEIISCDLKREGYTVSQARNGEEGLASVRRERPNLLILDIMLPGIDGLEICRRLEAQSAVPPAVRPPAREPPRCPRSLR